MATSRLFQPKHRNASFCAKSNGGETAVPTLSRGFDTDAPCQPPGGSGPHDPTGKHRHKGQRPTLGKRSVMFRTFLTSLSFAGRMDRRSYWQRFPVLLTIPVLAASICHAANTAVFLSIFITSLASLPLFSAGFRRIQDTGGNGADAITPWGMFATAVLLASWSFPTLQRVADAFSTDTPPDGPAGFAFVIIYGYGAGFVAFLATGLLFGFVIQITHAVAQTLLRSHPGPNKYGPNPNEVPK